MGALAVLLGWDDGRRSPVLEMQANLIAVILIQRSIEAVAAPLLEFWALPPLYSRALREEADAANSAGEG
jgi:hypothetical protein